MKKYVLLLMVLFLSGCSADYSINIKDNKVSEKLYVNDISKDDLSFNYLPINFEIDDSEYYNNKNDDVSYYDMIFDSNGMTTSYDFNYSNYSSSSILNLCYDRAIFTVDEYEMYISTSDEFLCFDNYNNLDDVTVTISSYYKLLYTNADEYGDNKYIWHIDKNNKNNKSIVLRLDSTTIDKTLSEKIHDWIEKNTILVIFVGIFLVIFLIILIFRVIGYFRNKV